MKPSAHNRWLERSFNKEDEPFDLGGSISRDTVQPATSFALCPAQRIGSSQLKLSSILPFFDICFALYLAGLPPAPWSGGQLLASRPHDLSFQLAASHYQFISLRLVLTAAFGNLPHTGRLGLPWFALHGFLFLARGTTLSLHTLLCFVF